MNHSFREMTPTRRLKRRICVKYGTYLVTLRKDFNQRCGYCNDIDRFRIRSYTIDHFVPQNPKDFVNHILPNYYYNLVYSCKYCNAAKTNHWPTSDPYLHNNGVEGFIDPVEESYNELFIRSEHGIIKLKDPDNKLAQYMYKILKLWKPVHANMWKLERIIKTNEDLEQVINQTSDELLSAKYKEQHYNIMCSLNELYTSIFAENL